MGTHLDASPVPKCLIILPSPLVNLNITILPSHYQYTQLIRPTRGSDMSWHFPILTLE